MNHHILVVDDDPHIRELLAFALGKAGMVVRQAADGEAALEQIGVELPDLLVLDINMPRLGGLDLCRQLRASGGAAALLPILFLSSRDDEIDRIVGLEVGGDDYVVKPFSPREVVARVGAILKRGRAIPETTTRIVLGKLSLDLQAWEARWGEREVALTATEFGLLHMLAAAPKRVFSRDRIIDRLHGPGFAITDRTIDSHVRNIRAKFARLGGDDVIATRAGVGYRIGNCA